MMHAQAPIAYVFIHDIEVGEISVADYKEILASVRKDWRIRVSGVFENVKWVFGGAGSLARDYIRGVVVFLGLIAGYAAFAKEGTVLISWWQHAAAEEIATGLRMIFCGVGAIMLVIRSFSGSIWNYPVDSAYEREVHLRVRRMLKVPSDGPMRITWTEEVPIKSLGVSVRDVMQLAKKFCRSFRR